MKLKEDNRGMTLAEMIITFALMGIFLAAVTSVISSSIMIHSELTGTMYAQSVGEILLDKITGELAAAKPSGDTAIITGPVIKEGETVGSGISFYNKEGNKSCFYVEDGILIMESTDFWRMDENAYMGYRISDFQIYRLNEENIWEVVVKIKNLKTGFEYTASRAIESFNFETEADLKKISQAEILL